MNEKIEHGNLLNGKPLSTSTVLAIKSILKQALTLEAGMDIKTLSEILGHKNASITLNRYSHSLMNHKIVMMNKIGKMLIKKEQYCFSYWITKS